LAKCTLDSSDPKFTILGNASDADLQNGLSELRATLAKDHKLSHFVCQPMKKFPAYQNKIWKWDFAPSGDRSSTRKGWRLFAYVPNPQAREPILARAFVCWDKSEEPKGNPAKFLAGVLKKFLAETIEIQKTEDRFRRQTHPDGRIISLCHECCEVVFSIDDSEADLAEDTHECHQGISTDIF
jgi:hypothetical protein